MTEQKPQPPKPTFIVDFWETVFRWLGKLSVFNLVRKIFAGARTGRFVDARALSHVFLSVAAVPLVIYVPSVWVGGIIAGYAFLRVFEVVVYQMNVLLFDEYRAKRAGRSYALHGYRRMILLLMQNYFEIIFWFAAQYAFFSQIFDFTVPGSNESVFGAVYTSFVVMTSFGFYNVTPLSVLAYTIVIAQAVIGLFMTLLSLARFIGLIPNPETMDITEK